MNLKRLSFVLFLCVCLGFCVSVYATEKENVKNINDSIVRFHIRANSNTEFDQDIKMAARKHFFEKFSLESIDNKEKALGYFLENRQKIEDVINSFLKKQNVFYKCNVEVKKEMFPVRRYNDFTLPAGIYDSVVITLGKGAGDNFFCVMYPSVCILDGITQTSEEKFKLLETVLTNEEVKMIASESEKTVVKFKIIELFNKFF